MKNVFSLTIKVSGAVSNSYGRRAETVHADAILPTEIRNRNDERAFNNLTIEMSGSVDTDVTFTEFCEGIASVVKAEIGTIKNQAVEVVKAELKPEL